jgi:quinoprotein dehydrogenase-associated probable ABC transporter substrate-binding protein
MHSRCRNAALFAIGAFSLACSAPPRLLRVCADPNNLPFSNRNEEGFENRIASLLARDLGAQLQYTWWAQRRGFVRNTLNARNCDLLIGVPAGLEMIQTTKPYYRSSYVFITRTADRWQPASFDDPALLTKKVGVPLIGDDFANSPPAGALGRRGIAQNVTGFPLTADYSQPNPPARIVEAVARGSIDIAVAWGPMAGYFAHRQPVPLDISPVNPPSDAGLPMTFSISMGVRRGEDAFLAELEQILSRRKDEIRKILLAYGVPLI